MDQNSVRLGPDRHDLDNLDNAATSTSSEKMLKKCIALVFCTQNLATEDGKVLALLLDRLSDSVTL